MGIAGKRIAITGDLVFYTREEALAEISAGGGIPQEYVTRETDFLVVGSFRRNTVIDGKSNKMRTAERYNGTGSEIELVPAEDFLAALWF